MMQEHAPHTILMTADSVGGVWTYALELCRELRNRRINVHLATMGNRLSSSQNRAAAGLSNVEVHESEFALEWMDDPWDSVDAAGDWLMKLADRTRPDLVHLNNYSHGSLPWQVPVVIVAHSCVLSWWRAVKEEPAPDRWNRYADRVSRGLHQADAVVAVSRYMLNELNEYYGPLPESQVIHNARSDHRFQASEKERIIFSMGRLWDEAKNISSLREISGRLPWPVYLAGDDEIPGGNVAGTGSVTGKSVKSVNSVAESGGDSGAERDSGNGRSGASESRSVNGLNGAVNMTSLGILSESETADWLGRAGIYVHAAKYEPFGLSVLEAALSGCALVVADIPSLKEIWGDAALYADPERPGELLARILELTENPLLLGERAREARSHGRRYLPRRFGNEYLRLYRKLLKKETTKFETPE